MAGLLYVECSCGEYPTDIGDVVECYMCRSQFHKRCTLISTWPFKCEKCEIDILPHSTFARKPKGFTPYKGNVKTGSALFIEELTKRNFRSGDEVLLKLNGADLTLQYLEESGFNQPIAVYGDKEELGLSVPPSDISWNDIEQLVGPDRYIDVINVFRQNDEAMKLTDFIKYMKKPKRTRILNVISLEVEGTKLGDMIQPPMIALDLDWVTQFWPTDEDNPLTLLRPKVQKYCLMAPKGAYTDFHIDFGGTSVWYHVLRGEKIFYVIKPTEANLNLFDRWMESKNRLQTFFADQVDNCFKITVGAGTTVMLPTGWIHAVLTSEDSLVFGGNFLHNLNISLQLRVNQMEFRQKIEERFLYPHFMEINWLAARHLSTQITALNKCQITTPTYLLTGLKDLLMALKKWNVSPKKWVHECIPYECSTISELFRDLSREIRRAEKLIMSVHPPKPQRESTRMKKKPKHDDFLDYSNQKLAAFTEKLLPKKQVQELDRVITTPTEICKKLKLTLPKPVSYPYGSMEAITMASTYPSTSENWRIRVGGSKIYLSKDTKQKAGAIEVKGFTHSDQLEMGRTLLGIFGKNRDSSEEFEEDRLTIDENPSGQSYWTEVEQSNETNDSDPSRIMSSLISEDTSLRIKLMTKNNDGIQGKSFKNSEHSSGIEELLKASGFTRGEILTMGRIQSGSTSPSTEEAIAGMLSIGKVAEANVGLPTTSTLLHLSTSSDDDQDHNVHQDDEYVYPSLENSSDDEQEMFRSRKKKKDEPWSPKAKVVNILPRHDRPLREGKRRTAVEKGLEAAAARKDHDDDEEDDDDDAFVKTKKYRKLPKKVSKTPGSGVSIDYVECDRISSSPSKIRKPKKGFATPKQRLGKILKLHKMIH